MDSFDPLKWLTVFEVNLFVLCLPLVTKWRYYIKTPTHPGKRKVQASGNA